MQYQNVESFPGTLVTRRRDKHHGSLRGAIGRVLTCRHRQLSRPFTRDNQTYLVCLRCGMRRQFDLAAWKPRGGFYVETLDQGVVAPHGGRRVVARLTNFR